MADSVLRALAAITRSLNENDKSSLLKLGSQLLENLEPFVLQAEMGLTERALNLLLCASSAGPAIRSMIYDRVVPWILMLVQGDVVNVRMNRPEIVQEGLRHITTWLNVIHDHTCDDILLRFQSSIFASLDAARETVPSEALAALYECLAMTSFSGDMISAFSETLQSLSLLLNEENRRLLLEKVNSYITSSVMMDMFVLLLIHSQDPSLMLNYAKLPLCGEQSAYRLCVGVANHEQDLQKVLSLKNQLSHYEVRCAISKGLLLCGKKEGIEIFEELLINVSHNSTNRDVLLNQLCDLFDFDSVASNPHRCLFNVTFLWKQRVFNQLSKSYINIVNQTDETARSVLMTLLPSILKYSENNTSVQQLFEFLPVFRAALTCDKETNSLVLLALPRFIAGLPTDGISLEDVFCVISALSKTLMADDKPMSVILSCLESLELLSRKIRRNFSDANISMVTSATVHALAHHKRVVRQKAAVVRNLWEAKRLQ
ncbi:hypothetical protein DICVIV_03886 [Dictyocaulus viviparus]|uniref:MMS19 nucleotide excision repair protein n=1 Tax=Dictyocaulus viviparus TaxID=29172 RepID=A0A0D8Y1L5_DICVI|nr:hypothetical protein DICVIV_03886 [Dictyocaulus viviparus]